MRKFFASLGILFLAFSPLAALAAFPSPQSDDSTLYHSATDTVYPLGTNLDGVLNGVQVSVQGIAPFGHFGSADAYVTCFTDASYTMACGATWGDGSGNLTSDGGAQSLTEAAGPTRMDYTFNSSHDTGHRTLVLSDYYELVIHVNTSYAASWGNAAVTAPYYVFSGTGGTLPNTNTRIVDFAPPEGTTTPANIPVTFSMHAYINPADIGNIIGVKLELHNIDQNILLGQLTSFFDPNDIYLFQGQATTSGDFYFSTSTLLAAGNYRINATLTRSYVNGFFQNPFSSINQDISHQFIVGTSTFIGHISQASFSEVQSIFASSTATSTAALAGTCNPLSFSATSCLAFLFVPDAGQLSDTIHSAKDAIFARAPWGYFTRFYTILTTSATSSLPTFSTHVFQGTGINGSDGLTWSVDPGEMLAGGATLIDGMSDPTTGATLRTALEPLIQLTVALVVVRQIFADLTKSFGHSSGAPERSRRPT